MVMSYGWAGKILRIDLTSRKIEKEPLSKDWAKKYLGGSGFGVRILYDEVGPEIDALSPESLIIIGQGPLSGTLAPSAGRYEIVAKSPLTGIYMRTNGGGNFGPEMKWAGYDLIIICGKSETPIYVWIEDDYVELRDASHLWGKDTWETRRMIRDELNDPDIQALIIGPAGENLCLSSAVISDLGRAAGRSGVGALWGSKNLKAVVVRGSRGVNIAKPLELLELCKTLWQRLKEDPLYEPHIKYGTLSWVGGTVLRSQRFGERVESLEETSFEQFSERNLACFGCPLHCSHYYNVKEGKYEGTRGEGFEATNQWGAIFTGINSIPFLCRFNNMCNQLGLTTMIIMTGIPWALDLYEAGIITKADTDGLELTRGNEDAILELVRKMAYNEGFGEVVSSYPLRSIQKLGRGSELYTADGKGHGYYGFSSGLMVSLEYTLAHAVATRGWDHLTGAPAVTTPKVRKEYGITNTLLAKLGQERYNDPKVFLEPWARNPRKACVVYDTENLCALGDMTGVCRFATRWLFCVAGLSILDFSQLLTAATGVVFTAEDLTEAAEREFALERAYNARQGIRRIDDYPLLFRWLLEHGQPHPRINYAHPLGLEDYEAVLDEYYKLRRCDLNTGVPLRPGLQDLGLRDVADDLENRGILQETKGKKDK